MKGGAYVYILECADWSFYVGSTRNEEVDQRVSEHQAGTYPGYTSTRRPVTLAWAAHFPQITDAISFEQQVKRWSRTKKLALIHGDWDLLKVAAKRRSGRPRG